jgi:mRNA interferase MazF
MNIEKIFPFEVFLPKDTGNLPKDSKVKADQIRTIDKMRLIKYIGTLKKEEMDNIEKVY